MNETSIMREKLARGIARALKMTLMMALASVIFGFVVMWLWNWLAPSVFGWHTITFWQALGLFLLSKILFGGFRGRGHHARWGRGVKERWEQMTPEQREKFRKGMMDCMFSRPASESRSGVEPGDAASAPAAER